MSYDLIIKNGLVILEGGEVKTDIGVKDGIITGIGHGLTDGETILDATGLIVSPGMVDAHVHITEPGGSYRDQWEGYETGTAACAKGGVTSFVEMPLNQIPATTDGKTLEIKYNAGKGKLKVDVASFGGLVPFNLDNGGIKEQHEGGVAAYKCFMATCGNRDIDFDFMNVDDYSLYEGMRQIAKTGKVLAIHAENAALTDTLGDLAYKSGETSLKSYVESRPVFTEVEAIRRAIFFAKETGCRIHICHVTCPEGVAEVTKARAEGVCVTCETCPHYLYFNTDELDAIGQVTKCSPPIRDKENQKELWKKVLHGEVDFVVSDHSPCTPDLKESENLTYMFISHDLSVIKYISDRVGVMYLGSIVELANTEELFAHPLHPYTEALLSAIPTTDVDHKREVKILEGDVPSPIKPPSGCKFHTRCKYATDICKIVVPEWEEARPGHFVACHHKLNGQK
mgnify:CR=1 FL=1